MNKTELIDAMADSADISKAAAGRAFDAAVAAITEALKSGDQVSLIGFGTSAFVNAQHARAVTRRLEMLSRLLHQNLQHSKLVRH